MPYSKEFFELQIHFARAAAKLIGAPLERALLDYTNLYVRFGLGRFFDQDHPAWRQYIDGLSQAANVCDWTYRFYLARADDALAQSTAIPFGCFSYVMQDPACVRIHFHNAEPTAVSPLSVERLPARLDELRGLLQHVKRNQQGAKRIVGTSWLYNIRAYRRCFPDGYVASSRFAESRFRNMSLWGQFVDRHGLVREGIAEDFKRRLSNVATIQDLAHSFPMQALAVEAPVALFFSFYELETDRRMAALRTGDQR